MHVLHYIGTDHSVQVSLHEIEYEVDVLVVLGFKDVEQRDDVGVSVELLQKYDLDGGGSTYR